MRHLQVADLMTRLVVTLKPTDKVIDALDKLSREHISGAPVVERNAVIGIVCESDILAALRISSGMGSPPLPFPSSLGIEDQTITVADIMSGDVIWVSPDTAVVHAVDVMSRKRVNRLPIIGADGSLRGIISRSDLVRAVARVDLFEILGQSS